MVEPFADHRRRRESARSRRALAAALRRPHPRQRAAGHRRRPARDPDRRRQLVFAGRTRTRRAGAIWASDEHWGEVIDYRGAIPERAVRPRAAKTLAEPPELPAWLAQPAPIESRPPRPLSPSALVEDSESAPPPSPTQRAAARRGTLLHSLFERLPGSHRINAIAPR